MKSLLREWKQIKCESKKLEKDLKYRMSIKRQEKM